MDCTEFTESQTIRYCASFKIRRVLFRVFCVFRGPLHNVRVAQSLAIRYCEHLSPEHCQPMKCRTSDAGPVLCRLVATFSSKTGAAARAEPRPPAPLANYLALILRFFFFDFLFFFGAGVITRTNSSSNRPNSHVRTSTANFPACLLETATNGRQIARTFRGSPVFRVGRNVILTGCDGSHDSRNQR